MPAAVPPAELDSLRGSQDRALEREGIPMILALVSESEPPPMVADAAALATGQRIADVAGRYWQSLAAHQLDDDLGCVVSVMHAVAYSDFNAGILT